MCGGISISKVRNKGNWVVSFVGTLNNEGTKNFNDEIYDIRRKE